MDHIQRMMNMLQHWLTIDLFSQSVEARDISPSHCRQPTQVCFVLLVVTCKETGEQTHTQGDCVTLDPLGEALLLSPPAAPTVELLPGGSNVGILDIKKED